MFDRTYAKEVYHRQRRCGFGGCETYALPPLAGAFAITDLKTTALRAFVTRLRSRSVLTSEEESALLALNGQTEEFSAHTDFVRRGVPINRSCLVVDGLVGRFGQRKDGARQITCLYIPGDMADLPSVVSQNSAWGLSALADTTILHLAHVDLRGLAARHPGIAEAFWRDCVADGSIFSEWVVNVGRRRSVSRVAHLFCEMAIRCERADRGDRGSFRLPITQNYLGEATGMTTIHLNRTLRELRERSVVILNSGTVTVLDWKQLVKIGDFDPGFMMLEGQSPRIATAA